MKKTRIGILDSGIGGIPMLNQLNKRLNNVEFFYLGDSVNAPYGNKTINQLNYITKHNIDILIKYKVNIIVFACNTLSVSLLPKFREYLKFYGIKLYGVYPPIESLLMNNKKTMLIATNKTIEYYKSIFSDNNNLFLVPLCDLASNIEKNKFNLSNVSLLELENKLKNISIDDSFTLVLGCTHFFL